VSLVDDFVTLFESAIAVGYYHPFNSSPPPAQPSSSHHSTCLKYYHRLLTARCTTLQPQSQNTNNFAPSFWLCLGSEAKSCDCWFTRVGSEGGARGILGFVRILGKAGRVTLMDGDDVVRAKDRSNRRRRCVVVVNDNRSHPLLEPCE
jgi:hypothetical protein